MTSYVSSFNTLTTPEFTNSGDQNVTITGHLVGKGPGRGVSLYQDNSDGTTTRVAGTVCDANGNFAFTINVQIVSTYHLYASAITIGTDTYGSATSAKFTIKSLRFWDDFSGYGDDSNAMLASGRWALRPGQTSYNTLSGRLDMKADARAVSISSGILSLKALRDPDDASKVMCGHITTGTLDFVRGHIEARIKFNRFPGAHGSAWHTSGYSDGCAELDVVEFFGERGPHARDSSQPIYSQFVQHTVYPTTSSKYATYSWTNAAGSSTDGPDTTGLFPNADYTYWNSWHTYEAFWNTDGYRFYIDGRFVGQRLDVPGATNPGQLILSLLVSDSEHAKYDEFIDNGYATQADYDMKVDWVRAWR